MIVCYAAGGGLGHLTRVRAFLHTVHPGAAATIISASPLAGDPRVTGPHRVLCPPSGDSSASWIGATLDALRPDEFVVDAFPAGLAGELSAAVVPPSVRTVTHLARLLRWDAYRPLLPPDPVRFDRVWCVEPLTAGHRAVFPVEPAPLRLVEPPPADDPDPAGLATGAWLVVHSGPDDEIIELLAYATETAALEGVRPRLVLVAPRRPAGVPAFVEWLDAYPAWPLFARAGRIVTAAGCNAVRQAAPWRDRHRMVPFPRRFDDQFARARRFPRSWTPVHARA